MVHPRQLTAVLLSPLRLVHLLHRVLGIAQLLDLGLCCALAKRAKHLHVVPTAEVLRRDDLVRLTYLLQSAEAIRVARLLLAQPCLPALTPHPACLFHAQPAIRLTRALLWLLVPCDRLCPGGRVYPLGRAPRRPGLFPDPVPGCPLRARQHELAAEHSLDFRL